MTKRRTQGERSAATQKALLEAAREVILERGFTGATTAGIARRAGVSRGAQLHHFATKQDLLLAVVDYILADVEKDVEQISQRLVAGTDEDIRLFICELWNRVFHPDNFSANLELVAAARTNEALAERLEKRWVRLSEVYQRIWSETLEKFSDTTPEMIALLPMTVNFLRGMAMQRVAMGDDRAYFKAQLEQWTEVVKLVLRQNSDKGARDARL